ncbi:MAG: beta strand repeat-containing protein [Candidatus Neomarinimicrobiota bacterium]
MRKFLLISVLLSSLAFAQKNNQYVSSRGSLRDAGIQTNSMLETVPRRLSYQGLLTKANGRAVSDGTYQVTFRLFKELSGGTSFWEETQDVGIDDGVISATLGLVNPISSVPANSYLEVTINETTLSPRQEMTSVFYSVVSDTAKYSQAGNYLDLDNRPDLSVYATKDTLSGYPKTTSLDSVAFTGSYDDLDGRPDLSNVLESDTLGYYVMTDSISSYTLTSNLASVALTNDYNDLTNLPDLSQYAVLDTLGSYVSVDTLTNFVSKDSVGTIAGQNSDQVNISGGTIVSITDLAIGDGGTGASDNSTARQNLGLEIGVDIQAHDADLVDLADGSLSAEKVEYLENVTSDVQAQINAIGDGPVNSLEDLGVTADSTELNFVDGVTFSVQDQLDAKQDLNANLTTLAGLAQNHDHFLVSDGTNWALEADSDARESLGLGSLATQAADNVDISGGRITDVVDIAIADGGTGASDITTARQNLGLEIGVDVQGYDADLTDLSDGTLTSTKVQYLENLTSDVQAQLGAKLDSSTVTLSKLGQADGNIVVSDGTNWTVENGAVARTSLGLGSIATQAADNVSITGGSVTDITDIAVADGGTGASDVSSARSNLGLEIGVDVQAYDADLADLADGKLSYGKVEHGEYFIQTDGTNGQVWTSDGDGAGSWGDVGGVTGAATTIDTEDLTASRAVVSNTDGKISVSEVTSVELSYVDGVTSSIQTQLNGKQDFSDHLTDIGALAHSDGNLIISNGTKWTVEKDSDARTSLGLGTIATQAADNVAITGGSITAITDIEVADGGTGASDVSTARQNLGLEIGVDIQAYDADLADLADGELSASKVQYAITSEGTSGQVWTSDGDGTGDWGSPAGLTGAGSTIDSEDLAVSRALVSNTSGKVEVSDVTSVELGYLDGVTSAVQTQLDAKQAADDDLTDLADGTLSASKVENNEYFITAAGTSGQVWTSDGDGAGGWAASAGLTGAGSTIDTEDLTASRALASNSSGKVEVSDVTSVELGYLDGVTSAVQTQLDAKQAADDDLTDLADGTLSASKVENNEYFITAAGTSGQVWTSDGDGAGGWIANSAATSMNGLSDALVEDTGSMYVGNDPSSTTDAADYNVALGTTALSAVTTGDNNTAIGHNALTVNEGGNRNTAVGKNALKSNTSGITNVALGSSALERNTTANSNTAVGHASSYLLNSGQNNVSLGYESSKNATSANQNVIIGSGANPSADTGTSNQTVVGYGATGQANNSITLGNADVTAVYMAQDQGATVYAAGVDITGSSGLILENDETITNSTDGTILIDGKADFNDNAITGYGADLQTESGTTKTLAAADNGTIIVCSSSSAITITVPSSLPSGFNCMIIQNGSGQVSLSASSTTLNNRNGSKTAGQYAILTLVHLGSDVFVVSGDTTS